MTLCLYGPGNSDIIELRSKQVPGDFFERVFMDKAKKNNEMKTYNTDKKIGYKVEHSDIGYGYFYFENYSEKFNTEFTIKFPVKSCITACNYIIFLNEFSELLKQK